VRLCTIFDSQKQQVMLEISDEGRGIEPEVLHQITDPFFTTRREQGGTGLGLAISQRIVQDHGGCMTFESTPNQGTTVVVVFPLTSNSNAEITEGGGHEQ
jgi:signal transduction histidine kinase